MKLRGLLLFVLLLGSFSVPTVGALDTKYLESSILDKASGTLTFDRWNVKIEVSIDGLTPLSSNEVGSKTELVYSDYKSQVYDVPGGVKWDIVLSGSGINVFSYRVKQPEGLTWYIQPPLSSEYTSGIYYAEFGEIVDVSQTQVVGRVTGTIYLERPQNIVGSYAVYYDKKGNEYKTGKYMHVYRPLVYDSKGAQIWGTMDYDNGILRVTVDPVWLGSKDRVFPVYVDPVFGKTSEGASNGACTTGYIRGTSYALGVDGTVTRISWYLFDDPTENGVTGIYDVSGGAPNIKKVESGSQAVANGWNNFTVNVGLTAASYFLCFETQNSDARYKYDSVGDATYDAHTWGTAWPSPMTEDGGQTREYSIYATYTVGGGPTNYPRSASQGITVSGDAERAYQGHRAPTQTLSLASAAARILHADRAASQSVALSSEAERALALTRAASQAINAVMEALGVKSGVTNFIRSATQSIIFSSVTNRSLINLLIRVVDALGQALAETSVAVWGSDGELIYSDSTGEHGYTDVIPFAAPDNITVLAIRDQYQSSLTRSTVTTTQTLTIILASLEDGFMNMERVAVLALTSLFYIVFVSQAWRGEFLRSLVYGAVSTTGWLVTAAYWWTGGWAVASVSTFFLGIGAVNLVQLLYAVFNYLGVEMAEQGQEWWG